MESRLCSLLLLSLLSLALAKVADLPAPDNLEAGDHSPSSFRVSWSFRDAAEEGVEYRVDQREGSFDLPTPGAWLDSIHVAETPVHYVVGTEADKYYDIRVKALKRGDDGRLLSQSGWSHILRVETSSLVDKGRRLVLEQPSGLNWLALEPNSVALHWSLPSNFSHGVHYRLLSQRAGSGAEWSEYRAEVKRQPRLAVGSLVPGSSYRFRLQARRDPMDGSEYSETLVATLPDEADFFRVRDVRVRAKLNGFRSDAVLNWTVLPRLRDKIQGFNVSWRYVEGRRAATGWRFLDGPATGAVIEDTKDRTTYRILITTHLDSGVRIQSQEFVINTKAPEPIGKLDVLYKGQASEVGIRWQLNPALDRNLIRGYNLEFAKEADKDTATGWRRDVSHDPKPEALLRHLSPDTTYYLRISPIHVDGSNMPSHSNFRFKTLAEEEQLDLGVQSSSPNDTTVHLRWAYPPHLRRRVAGALVLYNRDRSAAFDQWSQVSIPSSSVTEFSLSSLQPRTTYFVWIRPRLIDGSLYEEGRRPLIFRVKAGVQQKRSAKLCLEACSAPSDCPARHSCLRSGQYGGAWCVPDNLVPV